MTNELKFMFQFSIGVHAAALVGWPWLATAPARFDVERAPTSVEIVLMAPAAPSVAVIEEPLPEPVEPQPEAIPLPKPEPVPQTVVTPERQGALSEVLPDYLRNPPPVYPLLARQRGEEGTVRVFAEVLPTGHCGMVHVAHSSGSTLLDDAAVKAVQHWQFRPAHRLGQAVAVTVEIPITFRLIDAE